MMKGTRDLQKDAAFWKQFNIHTLPDTIEPVQGLTLFEMMKCSFKTQSYLVKRQKKTHLWRMAFGPTPR